MSLGLGTGILGFYALEKQRIREEIQAPSRSGPSMGKASVGGPFELVTRDSKGKDVRGGSADFAGKFMLIYFGFTFCPDICPDELDKISRALEMVDSHLPAGAGEANVVPIFISVDPDRDTPRLVQEYLEDFHPRFVGFTGTQEEIDAVAKAFRVYHSKDVSDGESKTPESDYLVDHSIITYLMGPDGQFVEFYGRVSSAEDMALRVSNHVREELSARRRAQRA